MAMQASTGPGLVLVSRLQPPARQPPGALNSFNRIGQFSARLSSNAHPDEDEDSFPLRTEFAYADTEDSLITNSLQITEFPPEIFEYEVDGLIEPSLGGRPGKRMTRDKTKAVFEIFVQHHQVLRMQRNKWTLHGLPKLIATSNLAGSRPSASYNGPVLAQGVVTWANDDGGSSQQYQLRVTFKGSLLGNSFLEYTNGVVTHPSHDPKRFEQALTILVGARAVEQAPPNHSGIHGDKSTVLIKAAYEPLRRNPNQSSVLNAVRCYRYTTKAGMGAGLLNISLVNALSFQPITIDKFMDGYGLTGSADLEKALKGVVVQVRIGQRLQDKTVCSFGQTVKEQTFSMTKEGQPAEIITVENYLNETYPNHQVKRAQLLAVNVGSRAHPCWYAPEQLHILPYQRYHVFPPPAHIAELQLRITTRHPDTVRTLIQEEGLRALGLHTSLPLPTMNTISSAIAINPRLLSIPFARLQTPTVQYLRGSAPAGGRAQWNLARKEFVRPARRPRDLSSLVRFVTLDRVPENVFNTLVENAINTMKYGMVLWGPQGPERVRVASPRIPLEFERAKAEGIRVIIFLAPNETYYQRVKELADIRVGIGSVVILLEKVRSILQRAPGGTPYPLRDLLANISLKVNLKCGGINHTTDAFDRFVDNDGPTNVMVMGADGTHPTGQSPRGSPTIVALTGTVDAKCADKRGALRLQQGRVEVIDATIMQSMAEELFEKWYQVHKKLPALLLYYRDGVSDSQYLHVKMQEVAAIRAAWRTVAAKHDLHQPELKITAMVVTKRHNTRFFPTNTANHALATSNGNVHPGTIVESGITSPVYEDWFCFSHHALVGTGKPAHYFKICDEWAFRSIEIQALTFALCFTYQRSTNSVSYPAPTYDADRLCERGRHYLSEWFFGTKPEIFMGKKTEQVFNMAVRRFGGNDRNPWHKDVDDTMLWL